MRREIHRPVRAIIFIITLLPLPVLLPQYAIAAPPLLPQSAAAASESLPQFAAATESPLQSAASQPESEEVMLQCIMTVRGLTSAEDLSEEVLDRFRALERNPIDINLSTRAEKLSSGLFTPYQVAVLEDWQSLSGDIMSLTELSALDGFGETFVRAILPFISITYGSHTSRRRYASHEFTLRSGLRRDIPDTAFTGMYGVKYEFSTASGRTQAGLALRSSWDDDHLPPQDRSFYLLTGSRNGAFRAVIGDYNLKFGQGLALWSGFSLSGTGTPASYSKSPTGIVPYGSYSPDGTFRGLAADYTFGGFRISAFLGGEGLRNLEKKLLDNKGINDLGISFVPGLNFAWYGYHGQASLTFVSRTAGIADSLDLCKVSGDIRWSFRGVDLFSELAVDLGPGNEAESGAETAWPIAVAGLSGARFPVGENAQAAVMARYFPAAFDGTLSGAARAGTKCSNEHGISASLKHLSQRRMNLAGKSGFGSSVNFSDFSASVTAAYSPMPKFGVDTSSFMLEAEAVECLRLTPYIGLKTRLFARYRTWSWPLKIAGRVEVEYGNGPWTGRLRLDAVKHKSVAGLGYCEGGYKDAKTALWLRAGAFIVDNWDDRIYVYERDAPGSFNIPSYYGRGYWLALTGSIRLGKLLKLYLRASYIDWPWLRPGQTERKPSRVDVRVQLQLRL